MHIWPFSSHFGPSCIANTAVVNSNTAASEVFCVTLSFIPQGEEITLDLMGIGDDPVGRASAMKSHFGFECK